MSIRSQRSEGWQSGLMRTPGERVGSKGPREFESRPLRQSSLARDFSKVPLWILPCRTPSSPARNRFPSSAPLPAVKRSGRHQLALDRFVPVDDLPDEVTFLAVRAREETALESGNDDVAQFARGHFQFIDCDLQFFADGRI